MSPERCPECGEELRVSERERRDGRGMCLFCGARFAVDAAGGGAPLRSQALVALRQEPQPVPATIQRLGPDRLVLARTRSALVPVLVGAGFLGAITFTANLPLAVQAVLLTVACAVLGVAFRLGRGRQELHFAPGELQLSEWRVLNTRHQEVAAGQIADVELDGVQRVVLRLTDGRGVLVGAPGEGPWLLDELRRRGLAGSGKGGAGDGPGGGENAG